MFKQKHFILLPFLLAMLLWISPYSPENKTLLSTQDLYESIADTNFQSGTPTTPHFKQKSPTDHKSQKSHHDNHDEEEWELIVEEEFNDGFENDDETGLEPV